MMWRVIQSTSFEKRISRISAYDAYHGTSGIYRKKTSSEIAPRPTVRNDSCQGDVCEWLSQYFQKKKCYKKNFKRKRDFGILSCQTIVSKSKQMQCCQLSQTSCARGDSKHFLFKRGNQGEILDCQSMALISELREAVCYRCYEHCKHLFAYLSGVHAEFTLSTCSTFSVIVGELGFCIHLLCQKRVSELP